MPTAPHSVLSRDELVEVYEIWQLLGPMATARAATTMTREQILEAARLVSLMRTELDHLADGADLWAQYNAQFHELLEGAGGGPRLGAILGECREVTEAHVRHAITIRAETAREANAEHEEILRAVIAGDAERAADATFRHINRRLHSLRLMRLPSPVRLVRLHRGSDC
jgi:DNA-binding GntR family transcriptional regulator